LELTITRQIKEGQASFLGKGNGLSLISDIAIHLILFFPISSIFLEISKHLCYLTNVGVTRKWIFPLLRMIKTEAEFKEDYVIQPGMTLVAEPSCGGLPPDFRLGVVLEENILVTEDGPDVMTRHFDSCLHII